MLLQTCRRVQPLCKIELLVARLSSRRYSCCKQKVKARYTTRHTGLDKVIFDRHCKWLMSKHHRLLFSAHFRCMSQGYKLRDNLKDCYSLLNVSEDCTVAQLKEAYIKLAKVYHPDSQSSTADPKKFDQLRDAYQTVKARKEEEAALKGYYAADDDDDDDDDDLFSTKLKPQHRQYLDNEGIGFGTRQQRQRQYDQFRISKAQDKVIGYKVKRLTPEGDNTLVAKDQRAARRNKIRSRYENNDPWLQVQLDRKRNSMERMVEDLIQESMSRGDFSNLSGAGKPLKYDQDSPYMDKITKKLNQILINESTQPEWIMLQKEIRSDVFECRQKLAIEMKYLGDPPYTGDSLKAWKVHTERFETILLDINSKIDKFNLICPILSKQMVPYKLSRELERVLQNCDKFLPEDFSNKKQDKRTKFSAHETVETDTMKQIWRDFKDIFKHLKTRKA